MKFSTFKNGWALLDKKERSQAALVLTVVVLSAATSAMMVSSIMPFLAAVANPSRIHEVPVFAWLYRAGRFNSDYGFIVALGLAALIVIVLANVIHVLRVYLVVKFSTMRMHSLSTRLLSVYMRQPYEFFLNKHSGELGTQILAETQQIVQNFYRPAFEAVASGLTIIAIVSLLLWVNPLIASLSLLVAGGFYVGSFAVSQKIVAKQGLTRATANRNRFRIVSEALSGIKDVKLVGRERNYVDRYSSASIDMALTEVHIGVISQLPQYVMQIVSFGGMIILGLVLLDPNGLSSGEALSSLLPLLGVFAFAGQRLIPELSKLYAAATQLNYGSSIVESIYGDLEGERTLPLLPAPDVPPMGLRTYLHLLDVGFSYPGTEADALAGISVRIEAGERVGVVGGSGSGKTTLADVLMGLLRATSGKVFVDGVEVTDANVVAWQRSVGYVQQGIFLSDATILENIALGLALEQIDHGRACEAARMARLDEFVSRHLPEGYKTIVGERGVRLSGGQRQRIGIARALYNHADLIVFDEATSALDTVTEREVMESIENLPGNKTVILIAHRLSTLEKCDRLLVLDHGKVVAFGTWEDLLVSSPHFQKLASSSTGRLGDAGARTKIREGEA